MGRQIAVAASPLDEDRFLAFLRETADIRLFRSFAGSEEELWVDQLAPFGPADAKYFIWNTKYAWTPRYRRTLAGDQLYIENKLDGPVIEFGRTDLEAFLTKELAVGAYGRVYWAQHNRQKGFLVWYEAIVRWLRQNAENLCPGAPSAVYCLPDALERWQTRKRNR